MHCVKSGVHNSNLKVGPKLFFTCPSAKVIRYVLTHSQNVLIKKKLGLCEPDKKLPWANFGLWALCCACLCQMFT